jgi:hypothetical protein
MRLMDLFLAPPGFPDNQFGFRERSGCGDAFAAMQERFGEIAQLCHRKRRPVKIALVSFDCSRAFDRIPTSVMIGELRRRNCPDWLVRLFESWLKGRSLVVKVGDSESTKLHLPSSAPQGSITGPRLFCLALSAMSRVEFSPETRLYYYADDASLVVDCSTAAGEAALHRDVQRYKDSLSTLGLSLNTNKSQLLYISFAGSFLPSRPVLIDGQPIPVVPKAKVLGIDIDSSQSVGKWASGSGVHGSSSWARIGLPPVPLPAAGVAAPGVLSDVRPAGDEGGVAGAEPHPQPRRQDPLRRRHRGLRRPAREGRH